MQIVLEEDVLCRTVTHTGVLGGSVSWRRGQEGLAEKVAFKKILFLKVS